MRLTARLLCFSIALGASPALALPIEGPEARGPVAPGSTVEETVWRLKVGDHAWDAIAVHCYSSATPSTATLVYLPGTNMNGAVALKDEAHNLWLYLAARGVRVCAMDYRTHTIPPETEIGTLTALKGWTSEAFAADVRDAVTMASKAEDKIFLAGFSRGGSLAYAFAAAHPDKVAGLVILDGSFKSATPKPFDAAAALAEMEARGIWASDVGGRRGWTARQALMTAAAENPDGPALEPEFKTIGEQLIYVLQKAWGPGGLANPAGGISRPQVLATLMRDYDRYYPAIQDIEGKRMAALADDPATPLDDGWGEMTVPILAFTSTGMGADWQANIRHSAEASGSKDVTVQVLQNYGHLDVLVAEEAPRTVFQPVLDWVTARAGAR
jgi:pimeloyl-ACP methyl ester carboxylesterase